MMPERANRTFICSVLFLDIAEYSKKPVSEQIQLKDQFNALIVEAIRDIAANDRIILDTGDGVAINFLGDPEDALFVAMSLREAFAPHPGEPPRLAARIGINLGPVRLVRDLNGQPNIIGDGINVAQRVMGFAQPGQVFVSRSYYEVVSHISEGYAKLFQYVGSRTDKHVREHEIYSVGYTGVPSAGVRSPAERAQDSSSEGRRQASTATRAARAGGLMNRIETWLGNRTIAYGTATLSIGAFALAVMLNFLGQRELPAAPTKSSIHSVGNTAQISDRPGKTAGPSGKTAQRDRAAAAAAKARRAGQEPETSAGQSAEDVVQAAATEERKEAKPSPFSFFAANKEIQEPAASAGTAVITLAVAPWGEVFVDGDRVGVSPPVNEVEVEPGRRTVEIRNSSFPVFTQTVDIKADQKVRIKHKFN